MEQLTKDQAVKIYESGIWKEMSAREIVEMQLPQKKLCVPFPLFKESLSKVLGRPVYTHELAGDEGFNRINAEVFHGAKPPAFSEIMAMLPKDKLVLIEN